MRWYCVHATTVLPPQTRKVTDVFQLISPFLLAHSLLLPTNAKDAIAAYWERYKTRPLVTGPWNLVNGFTAMVSKGVGTLYVQIAGYFPVSRSGAVYSIYQWFNNIVHFPRT